MGQASLTNGQRDKEDDMLTFLLRFCEYFLGAHKESVRGGMVGVPPARW